MQVHQGTKEVLTVKWHLSTNQEKESKQAIWISGRRACRSSQQQVRRPSGRGVPVCSQNTEEAGGAGVERRGQAHQRERIVQRRVRVALTPVKGAESALTTNLPVASSLDPQNKSSSKTVQRHLDFSKVVMV